MSDYIVTEKAVGDVDCICRGCLSRVGEVHSDQCILIKRYAKMEISLNIPIVIPASWDDHKVESFFADREDKYKTLAHYILYGNPDLSFTIISKGEKIFLDEEAKGKMGDI